MQYKVPYFLKIFFIPIFRTAAIWGSGGDAPERNSRFGGVSSPPFSKGGREGLSVWMRDAHIARHKKGPEQRSGPGRYRSCDSR